MNIKMTKVQNTICTVHK